MTSPRPYLQTAIYGVDRIVREIGRIIVNSRVNKGILAHFGATIGQKLDIMVYNGSKREKSRPTMAVE